MKTKILTSLILGIMLLATPPGHAQNILTDGDFSTTTGIIPQNDWPPPNVWWSFVWDTYAYAEVIDSVCNFRIQGSSNYYDQIQLAQLGFPLLKNHNYRLTFDVRADAERDFVVFLGENEGNRVNLIGFDSFIQFASTEWQTITLDFKAAGVFASHKLSFELGTSDISMYFDNIILEDMGPYDPSIGILGTSITGWDVDVDMLTTDNVNYYLLDFPLMNGRVKFRKDDIWNINWGDESFPDGIGYQDGPDIVIPNPGNYNVFFNCETGEYTFTCVNNCVPFIGITGSAVPPNFEYGPDVNMSTYDGIVYSLRGYLFNDGTAKFRQDDNWDVYWGNSTFPSGNAILNGEDIPVTAGIYHVSFNISTGDYSFEFMNIGIIGSALNGWYDDIDMETTDGINYTLTEQYFTDGEIKFREGDSWDMNWGGFSFPSGWAYQYYPNIPVPEGTYNVNFNCITGEYSFVATTCDNPGIQCPESIYSGNSYGECGALVYYTDPIPTPNCGGEGIVITQTEGLPSGSFFPIGNTWNAFMLTNAEGNTATCGFDVYIFDTEPPLISGLSDYFEPLWPPNHRMVPVTIDYTTSDLCGMTFCELYVYSNEPEDGLGNGDRAPDWEITDEHNVLLRAERSGSGTGREYHILILCRDEAWNYSVEEVVICVPHDRRKLKDSGNISGSSEESTAFDVSVWPNPGTDNFNLMVESDSDEPVEFTVYDIADRLILKSVVNNKQSVDFGYDLLPGIYIIRIRQAKNFKAVRVIKQ